MLSKVNFHFGTYIASSIKFDKLFIKILMPRLEIKEG